MTQPSASPRPADAELAPGIVAGELIAGKYRVLRVIGQGGMGIVVAASQASLDRTVAIKLIRGEFTEPSQAVERLLREAKAAASIQSEHVARVLDVGTLESGSPFIVMEYLEGHDLDTLIRRDGPLPPALAVDYLLQACEAMGEAHRNGIVHRDLKPANVFVARRPGGTACIKVVDFGISKVIGGPAPESLTHPSRVVGSLFHMAPEQLRGKSVDARTDVWALGLLLYEMLTGKKPLQEIAWPDVCARVLSDVAGPFVVPGDEVPRELSLIIQRCLERTPSARYQNVAEFAVALAPSGGPSARLSLERIVHLATSTGSPSATSWTPSPPLGHAPTESAPAAYRFTHAVLPGFTTQEPVISSAAASHPRRQLAIGAAIGVVIASSIASWLLIGGSRTRTASTRAASSAAASTAAQGRSAPVASPHAPEPAAPPGTPAPVGPAVRVLVEPPPERSGGAAELRAPATVSRKARPKTSNAESDAPAVAATPAAGGASAGVPAPRPPARPEKERDAWDLSDVVFEDKVREKAPGPPR